MNSALTIVLAIVLATVGIGAVFYVQQNPYGPKPPSTYVLCIIVLPKGSGTTDPESGYYRQGSNVTVTATPSNNYKFDCWLLDDENIGNQNPITILMNHAWMELEAIFIPISGMETIVGTYSLFVIGPGGSHSIGIVTLEHSSYILTVHQQKIGDPNYSWDGYTPQPGSQVTATGYVSTQYEIFGNTFYYLEVVSLKPS